MGIYSSTLFAGCKETSQSDLASRFKGTRSEMETSINRLGEPYPLLKIPLDFVAVKSQRSDFLFW